MIAQAHMLAENAGLAGHAENDGHAPRARAADRRGAFTLLEAMVAIGAMALVSVGLAAIFSSVGKTITGGKRLSTLNTYAALVEQQMRRDFDAMSRDGYLMIRNQYTTDGVGNSAQARFVPLSALDTNAPRARRIDEVMFFAKGPFSTAREATDPDFSAKSGEARVYYGHGARLPENVPAFIKPGVADANDARLTGALGEPLKSNEFAASWMLLRQVTLLKKPETTAEAFPSRKVFVWDPATARGRAVLRDKVGQIALHPAASSLFRVLAGRLPATTLSRDYFRTEQSVPANRPLFTSGIVDIATTDLNEVRTIVSCVTEDPATIPNSSASFSFVIPNPPVLSANAARVKDWMEEGWPAYSDAIAPVDNRLPSQYPGTRVRYEAAATNYVGVLTSYNTIAQAGEGAYRRADQMMLPASNFVPNCSEFIVEWSFGDVDPDTDDILWHGLERRADTNGDGAVNNTDRYLARPYPLTNKSIKQHNYRYTKLTGGTGSYVVDPAVVYNRVSGPLAELSQTAYFGYIDPNHIADGAPWAWPKLVRVTFTLADPNDAGVQQTFQFVFETPEVRS